MHSRPHGRELSVRNNRRYFELEAKALDPRSEMGPHLADVACNSNRHSCSTDGLTDSIFEFKAIEAISRAASVDVFSEWGAGIPRSLNGWEIPDD